MAVAMAFVQAPASPPPPLVSLLAGQRVALFVDFDGTLVEIASSPGGIAVPPDLGARLEVLADRLGQALALVSGRAVQELVHHLGALPIHLAGSHGAHVVVPDGTVLLEHAPLPLEVTADLQAFARDHGLLYEAKPHGAALHYRTGPEREEVAKTFAHDLAQRHALQIKHGKCVTELVRPGASKGAAVHQLYARTPFAGAAHQLGLDVTGAVLVNPYSPDDLGHAIKQALEMELAERKDRYEAMAGSVRDENVEYWTMRFCTGLELGAVSASA